MVDPQGAGQLGDLRLDGTRFMRTPRQIANQFDQLMARLFSARNKGRVGAPSLVW
jgi:hypothetical protein